jgi:hypothetical protein
MLIPVGAGRVPALTLEAVKSYRSIVYAPVFDQLILARMGGAKILTNEKNKYSCPPLNIYRTLL